ncbi:hypothetical protein C8R46DRAFT_959405 [Mycena filopes]|nr:hypothetical protein C8R46DRAFT_959405 [Mycena filopes]
MADANSGESHCPNCGFLSGQSSISRKTLPRHLLTTNTPPSDTEIVHIQGVVEDAQIHLHNLDNSIRDLEVLLTKLRGDHKKAKEDIHRGRAILSIVRRLPDDILAEIFALTLPDPPRRLPTSRCPWLLGRVCSRWRAVSISLSSLWSNIESNLPPPLLVVQIQRSNNQGLTIQLTQSAETNALGPLMDCSTRWASADIQTGVNLLPFLDRIHGEVPMLRELKYRDSTGVGSGTAFEVAPRLTSVVVTGKTALRLPWAQITRLRQRIPHTFDGFAQLRSAHNLTELSLDNMLAPGLARPEPGTPASIFEIPHLRKLSIQDGRFLDFLVLPALKDIYIALHMLSLTSLIDRSSCSIRKLTVAATESRPSVRTWAEYLLAEWSAEASDSGKNLATLPSLLLTRTPALLEFRLCHPEVVVGEFIAQLTTSPPLCPNLRSIYICHHWSAEEEWSLLVRMVESRANLNLAVLRVLDLRENPSDPDEVEARLRTIHRGTLDAKYLSHKAARRSVVEWGEEYP